MRIKQEYVTRDQIVHSNEKKPEIHRETSDLFKITFAMLFVFFCCTSVSADDKDKSDNKDICMYISYE
jgi:hypothetical protein